MLFSNPASTEYRDYMTVRVSYDEGKTWPPARNIDIGFAAYSCLAILPDRAIGLLYEQRDRVVFTRFTLEWLTGGSDR